MVGSLSRRAPEGSAIAIAVGLASRIDQPDMLAPDSYVVVNVRGNEARSVLFSTTGRCGFFVATWDHRGVSGLSTGVAGLNAF